MRVYEGGTTIPLGLVSGLGFRNIRERKTEDRKKGEREKIRRGIDVSAVMLNFFGDARRLSDGFFC